MDPIVFLKKYKINKWFMIARLSKTGQAETRTIQPKHLLFQTPRYCGPSDAGRGAGARKPRRAASSA